MNRIRGWKQLMTLLALGAALGLLAAAPALTQEERAEGFRNVEELKRLLEVARESGFSEQELREITIEDNGKIINVWEYLEEVERQKRLAAERRKAQREKVYYTVQDIFADLDKEEPADLTQLRGRIPVQP